MNKPYFIEYRSGIFINANDITELQILKGKVYFLSRHELGARCSVSDDLAGTFMNHLQAYNSNISIMTEVWRKQIKEQECLANE